MDALIVCNVCGRENKPTTRFCPVCGTAVAAAQHAEAEPRGCLGGLARLFSLKLAQPVPPPARLSTPAQPKGHGWLAAPASATHTAQHEADEPGAPEHLPYRLNYKFLTPAEATFFRVLQRVVP